MTSSIMGVNEDLSEKHFINCWLPTAIVSSMAAYVIIIFFNAINDDTYCSEPRYFSKRWFSS